MTTARTRTGGATHHLRELNTAGWLESMPLEQRIFSFLPRKEAMLTYDVRAGMALIFAHR